MKKILIIGAGFLQSFVIKKAKELGYYTLAVDADPNAIGFKYADKHAVINIIDEKHCLEFARNEQIDGVLTAATDYGVLTASYISQELRLKGLDYEVAKIVKNKYKSRKCLFENNVDDTEQFYEVGKETDIHKLSKEIDYPVMVKPCDGSGSRGATRVNSIDDFENACKRAIEDSITNKAIVESFIVGKEYGSEALVIDGEPYVFAIMKKWMTEPPYYAELGHAIPNDLPDEINIKAKKCVKKAIKALGVNNGSINMDILITDEGSIHIIDIGARMGGNLIGSHIIEAGTGIDYMAAMIQNAMGEKIKLNKIKSKAVATKLLAFKGGTLEILPNFKEIERKYSVKVYHHMHEGDRINEYHTNLDGYGYVLCISDDLNISLQNVEMAKAEIEKCIK